MSDITHTKSGKANGVAPALGRAVNDSKHTPVLLRETLAALDPKSGEAFADGTLGAGGHAREILKKIGRAGKLLALDWDRDALDRFRATEEGGQKNVTTAEANFAELPRLLRETKFGKLDGLLLDLGFSSVQLESGRGFSFAKDEPLAMTYGHDETPLADLLRRMSEQEICEALRASGERYARRVARAIFHAERKAKIMTTGELAAIVRSALPRSYERGRIDPATRTFLALRVLANREIENLERILAALPNIMSEGGRVAIISFQSVEDKLVKEAFRALARGGEAELITKKPIAPSREEVAVNPRSRSAKLRVLRMAGRSRAAGPGAQRRRISATPRASTNT